VNNIKIAVFFAKIQGGAMVKEGLYYSKEHEWVRVEDDIAVIGITDYAQSELGDMVFIELPQVGRKVKAMEAAATIEAVKAVADVYSPVSGEIIEVNEALKNDPSPINSDPYGAGWIFKVKMENPDELKDLLSPDDYRKLIGE